MFDGNKFLYKIDDHTFFCLRIKNWNRTKPKKAIKSWRTVFNEIESKINRNPFEHYRMKKKLNQNASMRVIFFFLICLIHVQFSILTPKCLLIKIDNDYLFSKIRKDNAGERFVEFFAKKKWKGIWNEKNINELRENEWMNTITHPYIHTHTHTPKTRIIMKYK